MKASLIKNPFIEFVLELSLFLAVKEFAYEFLFILPKPSTPIFPDPQIYNS